MRVVRYDICGMTHAGQRGRNEDAYAVIETADASLLAVADGVGGEVHGERAAQIAIESLTDAFTRTYRRGMERGEIRDLLVSAFAGADLRIREAAREEGRMGTTLVAAIVTDRCAVIANCGDSRASVTGAGMRFKTRGHTLVQLLLEQGSIDAAEARHHPLRSVIVHALGINMTVDLYEEELRPGETLVLCSDGLPDEAAREILSSGAERGSQEIARELLQGGIVLSRDDVTVIVMKECPTVTKKQA